MREAATWRKLEAALGAVTVIVPVESIAVQAAGYASLHALRGFDAVHLACARFSEDAIVTFDRELGTGAAAEGLVVIGS